MKRTLHCVQWFYKPNVLYVDQGLAINKLLLFCIMCSSVEITTFPVWFFQRSNCTSVIDIFASVSCILRHTLLHACELCVLLGKIKELINIRFLFDYVQL